MLFDTAVEAAGPILNMAGLQLYNLFDNSGGLILNVTLNVILVPSFHGLGAAVAWTLTFFALGTARILQVKGKVLGVLPFSSPMWNMLIAAASVVWSASRSACSSIRCGRSSPSPPS